MCPWVRCFNYNLFVEKGSKTMVSEDDPSENFFLQLFAISRFQPTKKRYNVLVIKVGNWTNTMRRCG